MSAALTKLRLIVFLNTLFLFLACSSNSPIVDSVDIKKQIIIGIESYPNRLDPRYPSDAYSSKISQLIFSGLLKYDQNLNLVPDLAERYEYIDDTHLRFSLRPNIKFHNGKTLSAKDVYYTYQSILDPKTKSPLQGAFKKIINIQIIDNLTLEITLSEAFSPIFPLLTTGIIPQPDSKSEIPLVPPGTGPYQFIEQKFDRWILLQSFADFYESPAKIPWLKFELIPDETMRALKLVNGELDLVQNAISIPVIPWIKKNTSLDFQQGSGINYKYLGFNLRDPILKKLKVRQAIAHAIDRESLIKYKLKKLGRPATGLLAPKNPYYSDQVITYFYDPIRAKKLLDDAGYPDPDGKGPKKRFTLVYKTSTSRQSVSIAKAIADQLEKVGIGVEIRPYEWATFYRDIRTGNFQLFSLTWVGIKDPDIFYYVFHSSQVPPHGSNRGHYINEHVDELIELARLENDEATRMYYYKEIQLILSQDLPYVSLWYEDNSVFTSQKLKNYEIQADASFYNIVFSEIEKSSNLDSTTQEPK